MGQLLDHPALALKVGLRVDLEIRGLTGTRTIFVDDADGRMRGPVPAAQPRSRVVAANGRFVMASDGGEIVEGMLDLRPGLGDVDHVVSQLDVAGIDGAARERGGGTGRRRDGHAAAAARRRHHAGADRAPRRDRREDADDRREVGRRAPILFADDVTAGYRVDIADQRRPVPVADEAVIAYGFSGVQGLGRGP